jgi:surfeit locus 1 family protein
MKLELFFSRTWWKTTLLVIVAVAVMIRLGIWQLDRLEQRRAFNTRVQTQLDQPVLDLNSFIQSNTGNQELSTMEYRDVDVTGEYDPSGEVVLRNQVWEDRHGVHLLTPLKIAGSDQTVLVNRGWVPFEDFTNGELGKYDEPGPVKIHGVIRIPQTKPEVGGHADQIPVPGNEKLLAWNVVNVQGIEAQLPYPLLPIYIHASPDPSRITLPYRSEVELELTEGPHMGYALQWFIFAAILGIGYPFYIRKENTQNQAGHRALSQSSIGGKSDSSQRASKEG